MNISDAVRSNAARRPSHPAVVTRDGEINFRQLENGVNNGARLLQDAGIQRGDVVGVALGDSAAHMALLFAVARIGAVILPVDRRWTATELGIIASHFDCKLLVSEPGDEAVSGVAMLHVDPALFEVPAPPCPSIGGDDDPLILSLSSGTTGRPKGAMQTHKNYLHRFTIYFISATFCEHDRFASTSPLYFTGSRAFCMAYTYAGGTVVLLPPTVGAEKLADEINTFRCTAAFAVPTMLRRWAELGSDGNLLFPDMRMLMLTGAAVFPEDWERAHRRVAKFVLSFYGSAEGAGAAIITSACGKDKLTSVGTIAFGAEVRIVDQNFNDLPQGEIGRICYRSPATSSSYYKDPEETTKSFHQGWYWPGDIGYLSTDDYLYITGREKDLIIRGGVNIYPNEIESVLLTHPAIVDAAVIGVPSPEYNEEVAACLTIRGDYSAEAVRKFCRSQLAPYKVPSLYVPLPALPKTSVGKTDKKALRKMIDEIGSLDVYRTGRPR